MMITARGARLALATLLLAAASAAGADGDVAAGKAKSGVCAACHGANGNSVNPQWPKLAAQHVQYLEYSLRQYRSGARQNALMTAQATNLSDQDISDLSAYFNAQDLELGQADPALVEAGEKLYRGGDLEAGVSACQACHGPRGVGNPLWNVPRISGQHGEYVKLTLQAYASGDRKSSMNGTMNAIASAMTPEQIEAVSSYVQGLR